MTLSDSQKGGTMEDRNNSWIDRQGEQRNMSTRIKFARMPPLYFSQLSYFSSHYTALSFISISLFNKSISIVNHSLLLYIKSRDYYALQLRLSILFIDVLNPIILPICYTTPACRPPCKDSFTHPFSPPVFNPTTTISQFIQRFSRPISFGEFNPCIHLSIAPLIVPQ